MSQTHRYNLNAAHLAWRHTFPLGTARHIPVLHNWHIHTHAHIIFDVNAEALKRSSCCLYLLGIDTVFTHKLTVTWVIRTVSICALCIPAIYERGGQIGAIQCTYTFMCYPVNTCRSAVKSSFVTKWKWRYCRSRGSLEWVKACKRETGRLVLGSWRQGDYPRDASGGHVSCTQTKIPIRSRPGWNAMCTKS